MQVSKDRYRIDIDHEVNEPTPKFSFTSFPPSLPVEAEILKFFPFFAPMLSFWLFCLFDPSVVDLTVNSLYLYNFYLQNNWVFGISLQGTLKHVYHTYPHPGASALLRPPHALLEGPRISSGGLREHLLQSLRHDCPS